MVPKFDFKDSKIEISPSNLVMPFTVKRFVKFKNKIWKKSLGVLEKFVKISDTSRLFLGNSIVL